MKAHKKDKIQYKEIIQAIPDVLYELDVDGEILFVSEGIKNYGYRPDEVIGKHFSCIVHPDDLAKIDSTVVLPEFKGKFTGDEMAPKLFNERRTKERMTQNMEVRILNKKEGHGKEKYSYAEVHASGQWDQPISKKQKRFIGAVGIFRDISHRKSLEKTLAEKEASLRALINNNPDSIVVISQEDNEVFFANSAAEKLFGYKKGEFEGKIFGMPVVKGVTTEIDLAKKDDGHAIMEVLVMETEWKGAPALVVSMRDQTESVRLREELREKSMTDELTGLYNRRGFLMLCEHQLKVSERNKEPVCVLFIDVDKMKDINDQHGHLKGDLALLEVASAIKRSFRESDILARIGGDEFAVLAIDAPIESLSLFKNRLNTCIDILNVKSERPYNISLSMGGMSCVPGLGVNIIDLLEEADRAMYDEKKKRGTGKKKNT